MLPLASPVKTRYQSVQGVTISIIRPICRSCDPGRSSRQSPYVKSGVQTKLTAEAVSVKRRFRKASLSFCPSAERKTQKSSTIRNGSMRLAEKLPRSVVQPSKRPVRAAQKIRTGCILMAEFIGLGAGLRGAAWHALPAKARYCRPKGYSPKSRGTKSVMSGKRMITASASRVAISSGMTGGVMSSMVRLLILAAT